MLEALAFVLAAVAVIVVVQVLADKTGLPAAALLTVSGLIYAVLPGPDVRLDPGVILTFVIPPLIYSAALNSSLLAIRKNLRVVISLSIGLVLATVLVVGGALTCLSPGWARRLAPPWALLWPRPTRWPRWRSAAAPACRPGLSPSSRAANYHVDDLELHPASQPSRRQTGW